MPTAKHSIPKIQTLVLELSQYPILASQIRQRMRDELFVRGVITQAAFDDEVREKAIESQHREGIVDPMAQEHPDVWQLRIERIADNLTDFYFAYNLPHELFEQIVENIITQRAPGTQVDLAFNPELATWDMLFAQGELYESYPPEKQASVQHHLIEIKAVLIKTMISDQLAFMRVARNYFTINDLKFIQSRRIGRGKIGGKAAGMYLAYKVLQREGAKNGLNPALITIPDSYFIGADVYYDYKSSNGLYDFMNQKYKSPEKIIADFPAAYEAHVQASLPHYIVRDLIKLLVQIGNSPLIVRSSSLLEDNFERSFAGKYDSFFLANQGTPEQNLHALQDAIVKIYASIFRPEVLIYRQQNGLIDYDERMAILIQRVVGQQHGSLFFPDFAGVGFSHNPYRWNERIQREAGLLRLVTGLGTRAVDRVGSDYPRMVALSHPTLRPERGSRMLRQYSQRKVDLIDLDENAFTSRSITEVFDRECEALPALMSLESEGTIQPMSSRPLTLNPADMIVTFDNMLEKGDFVPTLRALLATLEKAYQRPVDIEFAGQVREVFPQPSVQVSILQCRPLSQYDPGTPQRLPDDIPLEDIFFTASRQVPNGLIEGVRTVVCVDPRAYNAIDDPEQRVEVGQVIGRLNQKLSGSKFILMGPGRWGSSNIQLGVKVTYGDIYNTSALIEIAYAEGGIVPEVSYGTHFFQDLVEAHILPIPLYPDDEEMIFREDWIEAGHNMLPELLPDDADFAEIIRVVDVLAERGKTLRIVLSGEEDRGVAYLEGAANF